MCDCLFLLCNKSNKTFYILFFYSTKDTLYLSTNLFKQEGWQVEYGTIRIKLDDLLKESGLSKNMLSHRAEMQRTQINNYCRNQITRLDIDVPRTTMLQVVELCRIG